MSKTSPKDTLLEEIQQLRQEMREHVGADKESIAVRLNQLLELYRLQNAA